MDGWISATVWCSRACCCPQSQGRKQRKKLLSPALSHAIFLGKQEVQVMLRIPSLHWAFGFTEGMAVLPCVFKFKWTTLGRNVEKRYWSSLLVFFFTVGSWCASSSLQFSCSWTTWGRNEGRELASWIISRLILGSGINMVHLGWSVMRKQHAALKSTWNLLLLSPPHVIGASHIRSPHTLPYPAMFI